MKVSDTLTEKNRVLCAIVMAITWLSLLFGQFIRFEIKAGSSGLIMVDIAALLVVLIGGYAWRARIGRVLGEKSSVWLIIWGVVLVLSWVLGALASQPGEVVALGYLLRLLLYLAAFIVVRAGGVSLRKPFLEYGVIATGALLGVGVLIMLMLPDFQPLVSLGWDPHIGRLTSTWLDPNYFGTFLALAFAGTLALGMSGKGRDRVVAYAFLAVLVVGIYLTISRSALITLVVAGGIVSLRTTWRNGILTTLALLFLIFMPGRLQGRLQNYADYVGTTMVTQSPSSGQGAATSDPSASARALSWKRAWHITRQHPVMGVGYNFYGSAVVQEGLISADGQTRGTNGSDSSLLTLLATSGFIGLAAALLFFGSLALRFYRDKTPWGTAGLAILGGALVASQLNNVLLYPLILLPLMVFLALALGKLET